MKPWPKYHFPPISTTEFLCLTKLASQQTYSISNLSGPFRKGLQTPPLKGHKACAALPLPLSAQSFSCCLFWPHEGMGDLGSQPGIEPVPPAVEVWSLDYWIAGEFSLAYFQGYPLSTAPGSNEFLSSKAPCFLASIIPLTKLCTSLGNPIPSSS